MPGLSEVLKNSRRSWQAKACGCNGVQFPHALLGVTTKATQQEIQSAFRKASRKVHPDRHPQDKNASAKFVELARAKELLLASKEPRLLARMHGSGTQAKRKCSGEDHVSRGESNGSVQSRGKKGPTTKESKSSSSTLPEKAPSPTGKPPSIGLMGFLNRSRKMWQSGASCPKGHALTASCERTPWYCNQCRRRSATNSMERYQCRRCDFDLCERCCGHQSARSAASDVSTSAGSDAGSAPRLDALQAAAGTGQHQALPQVAAVTVLMPMLLSAKGVQPGVRVPSAPLHALC